MVKRTLIQLVDDLDGTPIDGNGGTLAFALEGRSFEIDLTDENAQKIREALAPFIEAGRRVDGAAATKPGRARRSRQGTGPEDSSSVREWARANGYTVSDRGRVSQPILEAYRAAH